MSLLRVLMLLQHLFVESADNAVRFAKAAADVLIDFLNGLAEAIREKAPQIREAGKNIAGAIIE